MPSLAIFLASVSIPKPQAWPAMPFRSAEEWRTLLLGHSEALVPEDAWERKLQAKAAPMWALIRTQDLKWVAAGISQMSTTGLAS